MTQSQIKVFNELLADKNFKGKSQLKHLLWLNTEKPKYEIGECFKVTDYSHRIFGHPVVNFNAKIVNIFCWRNEEKYDYKLEMICECGGKQITAIQTVSEDNLKERCEDNINILGEAKSKYAEESTL